MKKKLLSLLLVSSMAVTTLVGCGSGAGTGDGAAAGDGGAAAGGEKEEFAMHTSDDENTLTVSAWDANFNIPALEAAAEAYKEKNPDFKLEIIEASASSDVETACTTAGESGDYSNLADIVLFQDHYFQQYKTNYPDLFQDLSGTDIDWSSMSAEKLAFSTFDGVNYGAPVDNGAVVFAYRTDLLEEAGFTMDDVTGVTWEEFINIGEAVYNKTGKYLLCMDGNGNDLPFMMLQAEGASQFKDGEANLENNETLEQILTLMEEMQQKNVLMLYQDWDGYTNGIQNDEVAGVMNGNWIIATIKNVPDNSGKWAITTLPTLSGEEGYATNGGSSLYITANCEKVDLAKDFLAYTFCGGDGAAATYDAALANAGVISTWGPAANSDTYQKADEFFGGQPINAMIVEMSSHTKTIEQSDFHYQARTAVGEAITAIHGGADVKDALADAQAALEADMTE